MQNKKLQLPLNSNTPDLKPYLDSRVLIVSIFGKSARSAVSNKASILDDILKKQIFKNSLLDTQDLHVDILCDIDAYYDSELSVLFLHLRGVYDTHTLTSVCQQVAGQIHEKGFLFVWSELKNKYARAVLFLFLMSHILILSHPTYTFDISYVQLFKTLDAVRFKLQDVILAELSKIKVQDISNEWIANGRLCTPRILFLFESCPNFLVQKSDEILSEEKLNDLKTMEMNLEDQIFSILKKSQIVCSMSANALFAVPANHRFVYIQTIRNPMKTDWIDFYVSSILNNCKINKPGDVQVENLPGFGFEYDTHVMREEEHGFKLFLMNNINDGHIFQNFNDNYGRHAQYHTYHFERPLLRVWIEASTLLFKKIIIDPDNLFSHAFSENMDTDIKFSEARCSKVLPIAFNTYTDGLPPHYNTQYHENRVTAAFNTFSIHARGPLFDMYAAKLEDECIQYWTSGHQMCEVLSLKGNTCVNPLHKGGSGDSGYEFDSSCELQSRADLPIMEHSSGLRFFSTCDCGRTQGQREDPFSLREANYDFYQILGQECGCFHLDRFKFPVFQPSTEDYRAAQLFNNPGIKIGRKDSFSASLGKELLLNATQPGTQGLSLVYASGHSLVSDVLTSNNHPILLSTQTHNISRVAACGDTQMSLASQQIVIQVSDTDSECTRDKSLVRQPSTTEYLPGMLHSESPSSLLPQYPSWSLVYLGPSSLYSHNLGLQDNTQTHGTFYGNSAYLLPWDVTVRLQHHSKDGTWNKSNQNSNKSNRKNKVPKDLNEFSVKIFIGVEYECPLGHRFMASGPDKVLKTCGQGIVKDNGNKVTGSDMPLYFPCPCRSNGGGNGNVAGNSKRILAQLMRLHIVTPKAPVHVTLNPKVQPGPPPCPIFVTGCTEPIKLTQSAYWVLRLPYVYAGERGPYFPQDSGHHNYPHTHNQEVHSPSYARLLAGVYGITEITGDQKTSLI